MNGQIVSKGYGPNKREAKISAVEMLLPIICPKIYAEWNAKIRAHMFKANPNQAEKIKQENYQRETRDTEMTIMYTSESDIVSSSMHDSESKAEKENRSPVSEATITISPES